MRELGLSGTLGFNELSRSLPGRISRSVLTERLRRLETLGLVSRQVAGGYHLTTVGAGLMPVLSSLRGCADTWLPENPDMVERDPAIVLRWMVEQVRPGHLPAEPVVLEFWPLAHGRRYWLVLQDGVVP